VANGRLVAAFPALNTPAGVAAIAWSVDGRIAVAGVDQRVRVYGQDPPVLLEEIALGPMPSTWRSAPTADSYGWLPPIKFERHTRNERRTKFHLTIVNAKSWQVSKLCGIVPVRVPLVRDREAKPVSSPI
jgi:hypothetical protein